MIPAGWSEVRLGEVAEVRLGRQRSPQNHNGTNMRPYVRAANVGWSGLILRDVKVMNFSDAEMEIYRLLPGDLLLAEASGSPKEVGKPAIWNGEVEDCGFQNTLLRVRTRGPEPRYLLHYFRYQAESGQFASRSRGVGIYHLGRQALADLPVPLPSIEEQQRIAAVLDKADDLRAKRREAVSMLTSLAESIVLDITQSAENVMRLVDALTFLTSGARGWAKYYSEDGSRFVRSLDVGMGGILNDGIIFVAAPETTEAARIRICAEDVLLTITGSRIGRVAIAPPDLEGGYISQHVAILRFDAAKLLPAYVAACLQLRTVGQRQIAAAQYGQTKPGLNFEQIRAFVVPSVSIAVQRRVVSALEEVRRLRDQTGSSPQDEIFGSLQQRAFRGEL